ncbi:YbhB/YbcL family Raf kinase inhibitor-like protein [Pelistega sp. MC2]|uniref:YbhB/YbcL family Raf kinase inhibitor-like protein n=1 Tax=Pelistega sp. MC2 TaxID=1720297 RepID=UPI0008D8EBA2|nr:YbhB/YbcL family Raf kinase inhibitor-like protein [Pelistega sp. MC2]
MKLTSLGIINGQAIHPRYGFAKRDKQGNVVLSDNLNPDFEWNDVPVGTRSFALIAIDTDAPTVPDDVNRDDREVPASLPRAHFVHWCLIDIPAETRHIDEGAFSKGVTPKGKAGPLTSQATMRHGLNDYTGWFANDRDMQGQYFGYDGPCPPFNDALVHRYYFTLYALDIDTIPVTGAFTDQDVLAAIEGHILAQDTLYGTYTLNSRLMP